MGAEAVCLGVKRPFCEANPSNAVKNDRRFTSSSTICLPGAVHRHNFAGFCDALLPSIITSFHPSPALIALSFTFCLHTLLPPFFQMLEEPRKLSFSKVILWHIIIIRDFSCCYQEWKISLFVCSEKLKLLLRLFSNFVAIHIQEVCRKRDHCLLVSDAMYCLSGVTPNRVILLVTVVRLSNLKYKVF
jgi:hypothetical protein